MTPPSSRWIWNFWAAKILGDYFLARYAADSGHAAPSALQDFYIAYRAVVRAKVDCVRLSQGHPEAAQDAGRHLDIAAQHLHSGAVRLALVGGNPGTGKSTLARGLAEKAGAQVISTDDVRQELRGAGAIGGDSGVLGAGLYRPDNVAAVYEVALRRARLLLSGGQSVILDGTWRDPEVRAQARRLAGETHAALVELRCSAPVDAAADRIRTRRVRNLGGDSRHRCDAGGPARRLGHRAPDRHVSDARRRGARGPRNLDAHNVCFAKLR